MSSGAWSSLYLGVWGPHQQRPYRGTFWNLVDLSGTFTDRGNMELSFLWYWDFLWESHVFGSCSVKKKKISHQEKTFRCFLCWRSNCELFFHVSQDAASVSSQIPLTWSWSAGIRNSANPPLLPLAAGQRWTRRKVSEKNSAAAFKKGKNPKQWGGNVRAACVYAAHYQRNAASLAVFMILSSAVGAALRLTTVLFSYQSFLCCPEL